MNNPTPDNDRPADLRGCLQALLGQREARGHSRHTLKAVRCHLNNFLDWLENRFDLQTPEQLRTLHLHQYQLHLRHRLTAVGRPLAVGSINNAVKAVRSLLEYLKRQGRISRNLVEEIVYLKEPQTLPTSVLTHQQVQELLDGIVTDEPHGFRDRVLLELLYSTGIRSGELVRLTLHDVDLQARTLQVCGKGEKERIVPVGATACSWLENYIKAIRPWIPGSGEHDELFFSNADTPLTWQTLNRIVHRCCDHAGKGITAHTFRRSCATEMIRNNANIYHVKELLGHESVDTLKPYTKLTITDLKATHSRCHPRERDAE